MKVKTMIFFKRVITFCIGMLTLFTISSCTEDFNDLNTDPSLVTEDVMESEMLITQVQRNSVFDVIGGGIIKEYAQYNFNPASGTVLNDRNWSGPFNTFYDYLINISEVIRLTEGNSEQVNKNAIARIWRVWLFHQLTDLYGDVPYSEAVLSVDQVNVQPGYETQENIYNDMLTELSEAAGQLNNSSGLESFGGADLIYGGDVELWRRFANSLRFRLAMRVRYVDESLASSHISEVINAPLISDNSQNASITTEGEDASDRSNRNPLFNQLETGLNPPYCTFTITENLKQFNDPRLSLYCSQAEDPTVDYRGVPIALRGDEDEEAEGDYTNYYSAATQSVYGDYVTSAEYTINVMTNAEVSFLKAEAYVAGLVSGDAETAYREGVRASLEQYGIAQPDITNYLSGDAGNLSGSQEEQLEEIIVQKFLALYQQTNEAYAEYRRTGYPKIWIGNDVGVTEGKIPRRLTYPVPEYSVNQENVQEAASRLTNGDNLMSRIWWDAKSGLPYEHPLQDQYPPNEYLE